MDITTPLRQFWNDSFRQTKEKWNRFLPFVESITDRWERATLMGFGEKTSIYELCYVYGDVRVGKETWIGPFTILDGTGGLSIGDFCSISAGVQIYTHDSIKWATSLGKAAYEYAPTKIGNGCYIGPGTIIGKGVTIGDHCVIGANSVVLKDVPSGMKCAGAPAREIGPIERHTEPDNKV